MRQNVKQEEWLGARTTGAASKRDFLWASGNQNQKPRLAFQHSDTTILLGHSLLKTSSSRGKGSHEEPAFLTDQEADAEGAHSPRHQGRSSSSYREITPERNRPPKCGPSLPCVERSRGTHFYGCVRIYTHIHTTHLSCFCLGTVVSLSDLVTFW